MDRLPKVFLDWMFPLSLEWVIFVGRGTTCENNFVQCPFTKFNHQRSPLLTLNSFRYPIDFKNFTFSTFYLVGVPVSFRDCTVWKLWDNPESLPIPTQVRVLYGLLRGLSTKIDWASETYPSFTSDSTLTFNETTHKSYVCLRDPFMNL